MLTCCRAALRYQLQQLLRGITGAVLLCALRDIMRQGARHLSAGQAARLSQLLQGFLL